MKKILIGIIAIGVLATATIVGINVKKGLDQKKKQELCVKWDKSNVSLGVSEFLKIYNDIKETGNFEDVEVAYEYAELVESSYKHIMDEHISKADKIAKTAEYKALYVARWTVHHARVELEGMERYHNANKK